MSTETDNKVDQQQVQKKLIAQRIQGTVKWFNVKNGYGFISRNDREGEDVFVHQSAIVKNNPMKAVRSVGDGEQVEFDIVEGEKGNEAANVTGPNGAPVKGSQYAAERRYFRGGRGRSGYRRSGGFRRGPPRRDDGFDNDGRQDEIMGRRGGGGRGGRRGFFRGPRRYFFRRPRDSRDGQDGDDHDDRGHGGYDGPRRGGPRRFYRRFFRRRPRQPRSDTEGSQSGVDGDNERKKPDDGDRPQRRTGFRPRRRGGRGLVRRGSPRAPRKNDDDNASGKDHTNTEADAGKEEK